MVKSMSVTESLLFTAGRIFGTGEKEAQDLSDVSQMQAFARMVNG